MHILERSEFQYISEKNPERMLQLYIGHREDDWEQRNT